MVDKQAVWDIVQRETKRVYERNLRNYDTLDNKLVQIGTISVGLLYLILKFEDITSFEKLDFFLLGIISTLLLLNLILIIYAYKPQQYGALEPKRIIANVLDNENRYDQKKLFKELAMSEAEYLDSIKNKNNLKSLIVKWNMYHILIVFFVLLFLRLRG